MLGKNPPQRGVVGSIGLGCTLVCWSWSWQPGCGDCSGLCASAVSQAPKDRAVPIPEVSAAQLRSSACRYMLHCGLCCTLFGECRNPPWPRPPPPGARHLILARSVISVEGKWLLCLEEKPTAHPSLRLGCQQAEAHQRECCTPRSAAGPGCFGVRASPRPENSSLSLGPKRCRLRAWAAPSARGRAAGRRFLKEGEFTPTCIAWQRPVAVRSPG